MNAEQCTINKMLTEQIRYTIPPYQRPYSWRRENVRQLLEDLWDAYQAREAEYFVGSIITIKKDRNEHYEIVDGQQRLAKTFNHRISIEHVLPQRPKDPCWTQRFDEDRHAHWCNRLGNLTLLAGNRNHKAQGFDFQRKKSIYQSRGQNTSFDLLREICAADDWNEDSLKARQARLIGLAKDAWLID